MNYINFIKGNDLMEKKTLISVKNNEENYVNAVTSCGAIAVAQYCPEFSDEYDALILSGGANVDPSYYGEEVNGSVNIDKMRDEAEFKLVKAFFEKTNRYLEYVAGIRF